MLTVHLTGQADRGISEYTEDIAEATLSWTSSKDVPPEQLKRCIFWTLDMSNGQQTLARMVLCLHSGFP